MRVFQTDIVVISVSKDLQLGNGPLSKALLSKAGQMLQMGLEEEGRQKTPQEGSVLKTEGYNLGCSVVLHAVVPAWSQRHTSAKVGLRGFICLNCNLTGLYNGFNATLPLKWGTVS